MDYQAEIERLQRENAALRRELETARSGNKKSNTGCILGIIALGGFIFIILPVMAAIALPMYSTFKQKGKVAMALKGIAESESALESYYGNVGNFAGLNVPPEGGAIRVGEERVGADLPSIEGMAWMIQGEGNTLNIVFQWQEGSGCVPEFCDGIYAMVCENGICNVSAQVGDETDPLGMNF